MRKRLFIATLLTSIVLLLPIAGNAQGTVVPWFPQQFFTTAGAVCNACTLDTWAAGTTTAQATYSDSALATANANPVVMNSAGRPSSGAIYLSATSYRFRLRTSAGVTIFDVDNVTATPTTSGNTDITGTAGVALAAGDLAYLSDGSGALTAGRWYLADADLVYGSLTPVIGFVPTAIASGVSGTIRLGGRMTGLTGLTAGTRYYVSATAGGVTGTAPTNARLVGQADSTTSLDMGANPASSYPGTMSIASQAALDFIFASSATQLGRLAVGSGLQYPRVNSGATAYEFTAAPVLTYTPTLANVSNTTTETVALSFSVPANQMANGDVILVNMAVLLRNNSGVNRTLLMECDWGGTDITMGSVVALNTNANERAWIMQLRMMRVGTELWCGPFEGLGVANIPEFFSVDGAASLTANNNVGRGTDPTFTVTTTVQLRITLSAADATFYFNPQQARVMHYRAP